jgi:TetR/AcrR family transcriptional repressor of nem operon
MTKTSSLPQPADRSQERGRPREFDLDEVVDSAGKVFWEGGYHATSVGTLCDATGLLRGSLYGAFGDKHGLLIVAFERYADGAVARLKERLEADLPPRECLQQALLHYTRLSADLSGRHGCFITNAALELLPADEVLRPYIETTLERIGAQLTAAVIRGQQAGDFNADLDENAVGIFLLCIVQGLRVLGKVEVSEKKLAGIVDMTLRALL